jgi:hypothetical protein
MKSRVKTGEYRFSPCSVFKPGILVAQLFQQWKRPAVVLAGRPFPKKRR